MDEYQKVRVGLFGIGLAAYWAQFEGLHSRLSGYVDTVAERLKSSRRTMINFGLVDSHERAVTVAHELRKQDVDLLVIYVATYALSSTVWPIVRRAAIPVLVLNLQPEAAIDYAYFNGLGDRTRMTGDWLAYCSACPMPELSNVFRRSGVAFHQVHGILGASEEEDPVCWGEIRDWMEAAEVVHGLNHLRLGAMGHYYPGMMDIATDLTALSAAFGVHVEMLEVDELSGLRRGAPAAAVQAKLADFAEEFEIDPGCSALDLELAARTSVGLDQLCRRHGLGALCYFYSGSAGGENEKTIASIILGASILTAQGTPAAGEYEIKNAVAMKIMEIFGAGGSFTEFYAVDFADDVVLMGHDGPGHVGMAEGKTRVRPLRVFHGKVSEGLSVEMSVKAGPVTLLSIAESRGRGFKLLVAEGWTEAGEILQIGNTNSRYRFAMGAREFLKRWVGEGPAHHCAVGEGHIAHKVSKLALLLGTEFVDIGASDHRVIAS